MTWIAMNAACDNGCPAGGAIARLDVSSTAIMLEDPTVPSVTGLSGGLLANEPLSGRVDASFTASDKGPGIYSAWFVIDGEPQPRELLDQNTSTCTNLEQATDGTRSFSTPEPCAETISGTIALDTTALSDGRHTVRLEVDDASGNTTIAYDQTVTTRNAPSIDQSPSIAGQVALGATLTGTPGIFTAQQGAGTLSGITQSWLRYTDPAGLHCSPIPAANGEQYTPSTTDAGYYIVYQNTVSDNDGTTVADSPPTVVLAGTPQAATGIGQSGGNGGPGGNTSSGSTSSATAGPILLDLSSPAMLGSTSPWQITLKVKPHTVRRGTRLTLYGTVTTSPRPAAGKLIYLQARTVKFGRKGHGPKKHPVALYGKWITFMHLRAKSNGCFVGRYKFKDAGQHEYQFAAIAPQEGNYLNTTGTSKTVTVHEL